MTMTTLKRSLLKIIAMSCIWLVVFCLSSFTLDVDAQSQISATGADSQESLLTKAPFDRIVLTDKSDLLIEPVSPRPLPPAQKKPAPRTPNKKRSEEAEARAKEMENDPAIRILVQPLEADGIEYAVYREDVAEIVYFDDMLLKEADRLIETREFAKAFEYLLYLQNRDPQWAGLAETHRKLLLTEAKERFDASETESGLQFVNEVLAKNSGDSLARSLAIEGLAKLANADIAANRLERTRESHSRIKSIDPNAESLRSIETQLKAISLKLLDGAPEGRPERLDQLNEAYRAWPDTPGLAEARTAAQKLWPTVRVAVSETVNKSPRPWAAGPTGKRIANLLFLPLLENLQEGSFKGKSTGQLLDRFEMTDLTTATLTVKSGLKWSNGREINARDIVAAMSAWAQPTSSAFHGVWASLVESVSVQDSNKVQVKLTRPIFQPEAWLLRPIGPAENSQAEDLPASAWLGSSAMIWQGSSTESAGDQAVFIRQPDLNTGIYRIQEIVIPDEQDAWQALLDGRVDMIEHVPSDIHGDKPSNSQIQIIDYASPEIHVLAIDGRNELFQNRSFRRALGYALNRPEILEEQFLRRPPKPDEIIADGVFVKGSAWDDKSVKPQAFDRALATLLFASTRREMKTERIKFKLEYPARQDVARTCSRIADDLKLFGIEVELSASMQDSLEEKLASGNRFELAYRILTPTTDHFQLGGGIAPSIYARPSTNGLAALSSPLTLSTILDVERAWDETRVRESAQFIDRLCREELPVIPLWQIPRRFAHSSQVTGIRPNPYLLYENLRDWQLMLESKP